MRQWGLLFDTQATANPGEAVTPFAFDPPDRDTDLRGLSWWPPFERLYGSQIHNLLLCPVSSRLDPAREQIYDDGWHETLGGAFSAWGFSPPGRETMVGSYGFWAPVGGGKLDFHTHEPLWTDTVKGPISAIVPIMFDCDSWIARGDERIPPPRCDDLPWFEAITTGWGTLCFNRHNGGENYLFLDWSARKVGLKELWTLKWGPDYDTRGPWTKAGGVKPEDWPRWMRGFKDY